MTLGFSLWVPSSLHVLGRSQEIGLTFPDLMSLGAVASAQTGSFIARVMIIAI